ncbi:MAG TPA: prepilin-type N-terminal cleavage/methylation domain-containing protein [Chitinispirillaceae bacterium]|jgi:Tfp pilus assembly protein PilV|nr:prepilin-type N-terminal cleavage/methylation domain-containing protein [Chitinispirillaceae bacterium]
MNAGKNIEGSSLIEVVVAMIILALLVTGLNACVVSLINSNQASKELSAATSAGYQLLEELRRTDYDEIVTNSDVSRNKYIRSWTVTTSSNQKKIVLNVQWPVENPRHSIELSTIIAKL